MNLTLEDAEDISDEQPVKLGTVFIVVGDNILGNFFTWRRIIELYSSNIKSYLW